ncbi:hypothetical protein FQZ97_1020930 [compost metagenome]
MALLHQVVQRAHGFLDGRDRVEAVDLVEVDVVQLQAPEARLHAVHDVVARGAGRVHALAAGFAQHLGRDHHAVARHLQVLQRLTGDGFGEAVGVHVGGVDEVDAGIERAADEAFGLALLQLADMVPDAGRAAEGHRAEAEFGNQEAGAAEFAVLHRKLSFA